MDFKQKIKENRPNVSESTLKTYQSVLSSLWKKCSNDEECTLSKLKLDKLKPELDKMPLSTRKTTLSALFVLTNNDVFKKLMMEDIEKTKQINAKQEMNEKQKESYVSQQDLHIRLTTLRSRLKILIKKKIIITIKVSYISMYIKQAIRRVRK